MSVFRYLTDNLRNLVANLGTERDKASSTYYGFPLLDDQQLVNMYRGAWLPRKIVDVPALDACREWRGWQANSDQIEKIEAEEKRLAVQQKVKEALTKARLFGGAAIYIGTGDRDPRLPLKPDSIRAGGIKRLTVLTRRKLNAGRIEQDIDAERYGKPALYTLPGGTEIHPSRLVIFIGNPHPDDELAVGQEQGWGDSVLLAIADAIKNSDSTAANIASLVFEAKVDVISIPDFMEKLGEPGYEKLLMERLRLAAMAKGINGMLALDASETYEQKSANFASLTDILMAFLQIVSGAADMPMTRLLGTSPGGLGSSGAGELINYYDGIKASQQLTIGPAMTVLDECLIRSALGARPAEVHYTWNSLWQPTAVEKSTIGKTVADTIKTLSDSKLFPEEALSAAAVTMLVENSVMPGLEAAIEEFGSELPDEDEAPTPQKIEAKDATPRSLYVSRKVLNAAEIIKWAKSQGMTDLAEADSLHVTIAYSTKPVDWLKMGEGWDGDRKGVISIAPGGPRIVEPLGNMTAVLMFASSSLTWRNRSMIEAGASWDWPDYTPHISLTKAAIDLSTVEPYRGRIELGPEIFEEIEE